MNLSNYCGLLTKCFELIEIRIMEFPLWNYVNESVVLTWNFMIHIFM